MNSKSLIYKSHTVTFHDLQEGGVDNGIRLGYPLISQHEERILERLFKPGDVVYDIGAYIGTHSIFFALNGADVEAFEPSPRNYTRLCINTLPYTKDIGTHQVAFHNKSYLVTTLFKDCNTSTSVDTEEQMINYVLIEEYIRRKNLPWPNLIKMDIEGMESLVLGTCQTLFSRIRPIFYVELHPKPRECKIQDYEDNPHWRWKDEGGFDFNELKDHDYNLILYTAENQAAILYQKDQDWNEGLRGNAVLIHKNDLYKI